MFLCGRTNRPAVWYATNVGPTVARDKRGLFTDVRMASGENVSPFPVGPDIWYREWWLAGTRVRAPGTARGPVLELAQLN